MGGTLPLPGRESKGDSIAGPSGTSLTLTEGVFTFLDVELGPEYRTRASQRQGIRPSYQTLIAVKPEDTY